MKISDVIKDLEKFKKALGDCAVHSWDVNFSEHPNYSGESLKHLLIKYPDGSSEIKEAIQ